MNEEIFAESRVVFLDTVSAENYVHLDRIASIYKALKESIQKPLKMVLLYGKPGTGKSMFLSKIHQELSQEQPVFLYKTPILDENEFFKTLAQDMFDVKYDDTLNFTQFMKILTSKNSPSMPIILLDEAQLYSNTLMEKIRLLSDTRKIKFVVTLHKTEEEDLIAKEHFQTRIWESIELENASLNDLNVYIHKKLLKANCFDSANMFDKKSVALIHKITFGNYRNTNKLLYSVFDIYVEYYKQNRSNRLSTTKISTKIIEMAAIQVGLIYG